MLESVKGDSGSFPQREGKGVDRRGDEVPPVNGKEPEEVDARELLRATARAIEAVRRGLPRMFDRDGSAGEAPARNEGDDQEPEA